MDRWEKIRVATAATAAVGAVLAIWQFATLVYRVDYPLVDAYVVPDVAAPAVDLAAVQRSWPSGLGEPAGRARLLGYMRRIERLVVPASAATAPVVAAEPQPQQDLATLLAHADIALGKRTARVCASCHSFDQGGPNRIGPNLWGVVGRKIAGQGGFNYSAALKAQPGNWSYEKLDDYLTRPSRAIPGNKMAFAGVRKAEDRASLLAYLRSLSTNPPPLPKS